MGHVAMAGGAEFGGRMAELDRRALELAGGDRAAVHLIPAAAAPDNNHEAAGARGVNWFRSIGATTVSSRAIIDRATADDRREAELLGGAGLIYLLGGFPAHLAESLRGSRSWQAALAACRRGAVIAGSSAGAMVLCDMFYDPGSSSLHRGLGLIENTVVIPHHERTGPAWAQRLQALAPEARLLGLDEMTGIIDDGGEAGWTVYGAGAAVVYGENGATRYGAARSIPFAALPPPHIDRGPRPW